MRNLKKFLALTLALLMVLSVMVTVHATDLKPDGEITDAYRTAVDVLAALDVLKGDSQGVYRPDEPITRAEFATMIYRVDTGDVDGSEVGVYAEFAEFDDVKEGDWFAGYVGYAQANNLLVGDGARYYPRANVTGYQVLTGLLRVLGYDQNGELTGNRNWKINALTRGKTDGLTEGVIGAPWSREITRETVAQIFFDTLANGHSLTYNSDTNTYTPASGPEGTETNTAKDPTLGNVVFGLITDAATDAFGRAETVWTAERMDAPVQASVANGDVSYTVAVTNGKIYTDLGLNSDIAGSNVTLLVDGKPDTTLKTNGLKSDGTDSVGGRGALTEVYKTEGNKWSIIVINTYVKKLSATDIVAANDASTGYITLEGGLTYETDSFAAGDVVCYNTGATGEKKTPVALNVKKLTALEATVTQSGTDAGENYVRLNDETTKYFKSTKCETFDTLNVDKDTVYNVYLDQYGNVLYAEVRDDGSTATVDQYVYVIDAESTAGSASGSMVDTDAKPARAVAKVADPVTGETSELDLAVVKDDGKWYYSDATGGKDGSNEVKTTIGSGALSSDTYLNERVGHYCRVTDVGDTTVLTPTEHLTISSDNDVSIKKGEAKVPAIGNGNSNMLADDETRLVVLVTDDIDDGEKTYRVDTDVTGYKNFPTLTHKQDTLSAEGDVKVLAAMFTKTDDDVLKNIYLVIEGKAAPATLGMFVGEGEQTTEGTIYTFFVGGKSVNYLYNGTKKLTDTSPGNGFVRAVPGTVYELTLDGNKLTGTKTVSNLKESTDVTLKTVHSSFVTDTSDTVYYLGDECFAANSHSQTLTKLAVGDKVTFYYPTEADKTAKKACLAVVSTTDTGLEVAEHKIDSPATSNPLSFDEELKVSISGTQLTITGKPNAINKKVTANTTQIKVTLTPTGDGAKVKLDEGSFGDTVEITLTNSSGTTWSCSNRITLKPADGAEVTYSVQTITFTPQTESAD